jgi:lipopolysaccharide transport system permease protein
VNTVGAGASDARHHVRIVPPGRWGSLRLREFREYRELLYFLTKRELQIRYKQSFFGISWAILQPVTLAFIFALFFGRLANVPSEGIPYPVFALAALVPWIFVSGSVSNAALSLVADANLLSKVYFPRLMLPLAKILALFVDLIFAVVVLFAVMAIYGVGFEPTTVLLPLFLLLAVSVAVAVGVLLAAVNIQYRDIAVAVPLLVQTWLFATPVIYPGSLIEGTWRYIYALNPMVSVVDGVRWALLDASSVQLGPLGVSLAVIILLLTSSVLYFRRAEQFFADVA